jgi:F-type H+-transporting ATPase subunit b
MLIDWFTVAAQAINFLILVWLLKRFLYKPVLSAIDAREAKIAAELKDAVAKKAEAQAERDDFRTRTETLERQRTELLSKARDEANAERQRLLGTARREADALRSKLNDTVKGERRELNREIVTRTQQEVFAVARKTLADLAGISLEDRIVEVFIDRLSDMTANENAQPTAPPRAACASALVRSAFELPPARRAVMENAVRAWLGADTKLSFETMPDLVSGIELSVDGRKLAWSVTDYLASLAQNVTDLLEPKADAIPPAPTNIQHAVDGA